jgi:hypothetical protein
MIAGGMAGQNVGVFISCPFAPVRVRGFDLTKINIAKHGNH